MKYRPYRLPRYTSNIPAVIMDRPKILSTTGLIPIICSSQIFIFSGKTKYGNPSIIITMPMTHKKNFIFHLIAPVAANDYDFPGFPIL